MRLWVSPYELVPRGKISELAAARPRRGVLLKIEFDRDKIGYADLFPWTELGDEPLLEQINRLKTGEYTALGRSSLAFARRDAEARAQGISLWDGLEIPASHFLILNSETPDHTEIDRALEAGFTHFKAKLPPEPARAARIVHQLVEWIGPRRKLRLDFNSGLNAGGYAQFANEVEFPRLDFIEDPTPWNPESGFRVPADTFPLAVDRESALAIESPICPRVIIVKPAAQEWEYLAARAKKHKIRAVFTSYLDHPMGQAFAALAAALAAPPLEIAGLISHPAYAANAFSELLSYQGPKLIVPREGTGIGFDDLLEKRRWKLV
ncbi:MAG: enolase C-terminal domain-like protein [Oligoflexia bacterium]|nr:enolase C-terminal domain-like protein [Oligoflexia bacterium]